MAGGKQAKKNGHKSAMKWLAVLLAVVMIIAVCVVAFVQVQLGKMGNGLAGNYEGSVSSQEDVSTAPTITEVDWGDAGVVTSVNGVCNILLLGQDSRTGNRGNSDTMIILSINQNTNQLTMISLMRDLYVQIPGQSEGKLNAAYLLGGAELLDQTISENFGILIDYNVVIDFNGFKDIVDTLGGVDVELTEKEAEYLSGGGVKYTNGRTYDVQEGLNHLDGTAALDYARIRHTDSDFYRTARQRNLIQTIYGTLRTESWDKLLEVYDAVADDVSIDMNTDQLVSLAFSAYSMGLESINSYRIPADKMYTNETVKKWGEVLVPTDWNLTRDLVKTYLYNEDPDAAAQTLLEEAGVVEKAAEAE